MPASFGGKLVGAILGVVLIHGWPGFLIGLVLGHIYDRWRDRERAPALAASLIAPLFAFAGALAKADGRVSESEIAVAEALMHKLGLDAEQRRLAIERFTAGKQAGFDVQPVLAELRAWCRGRGDLSLVVLDPLIDLAYASGTPVAAEQALLDRLCAALGISPQNYAWLVAMKGHARVGTGPRPGGSGSRAGGSAGGGRQSAPPPPPQALDPYEVLGVARGADERTVKQAYRKLMSQHHPDKLGDVPPAMKRRAEERASEINAAWERIKAERGFR